METLAKMKPASRKTAPSPPAMRPASTTAPRSSCWPQPMSPPGGPQADRTPGVVCHRRRAERCHGRRPDPGDQAGAKRAGLTLGPDGRHRIQRSVCRPVDYGGQGAWNSIRPRPTRTAALSRSVTRSAPAARSSSPRRSMNCNASVAVTRWSPCASAAARASR